MDYRVIKDARPMIAITSNPVDVILAVSFGAPCVLALVALAVTWWEGR